jgi:hypothetical protein
LPTPSTKCPTITHPAIPVTIDGDDTATAATITIRPLERAAEICFPDPYEGDPALMRGVHTGQRKIGQHPHRQPAARGTATAHPAPHNGFLFLDREKFPASFAADLPARQAAFMTDSQLPGASARWTAR